MDWRCEMKQRRAKRILAFWGTFILVLNTISSSQIISTYAEADISIEATEAAAAGDAVSEVENSPAVSVEQNSPDPVIESVAETAAPASEEASAMAPSEPDTPETAPPEQESQETAAPSDNTIDLITTSGTEQTTNTDVGTSSMIQEQDGSSDPDSPDRTEEEQTSAASNRNDPDVAAKLIIPASLPNYRTVDVRITWADETEKKPKTITCTLLSDQSDEALTVCELSEADASEAEDGTITWSKTLPEQFPVYSQNGDMISYRIEAVDSDNRSYSARVEESQTQYQNLYFYIPAETIKEGDDYLLADEAEGNASLYISVSNEDGQSEKISARVITGEGFTVRDQEGESSQSFFAIRSSNPQINSNVYLSALNQVTWRTQKDASGACFLVNCNSGESLSYPLQNGRYVLFHKVTPTEMPVENAASGFLLTREEKDPQDTESLSEESKSKGIFTESLTEEPTESITEEPTESVTESQTESISEESNSGKTRMFSMRAMRRLNSTDSSAGKRTITIKKTWEGENGDTSKRPDSLEFILYTDDPSQPLKTVSLTKANATNSTTWEYTLPEQYPIYDTSGNMIEYHMIENMSDTDMAYYRMNDSSSTSTLQTGYSGVSVYVPVIEIEDGADYLVTDGSDGAVSLFRAEAPQTDGVLTTAAGTVNVLSDRTLTGEDGTAYSRYILIKDTYYKTLGGEPINDADFMTWRAHAHNNGTILTSNAYRLWGLEDSGDENRYSGFLTFSGKKWKITKSDSSTASADSLFFYDASTGGFRTENGQTLYLFKKVSVQDDLSDQAETKFMFTNYRHSDVMDIDSDPAPISDSMDVKVEKQWADQEDHSGATVTIALLANGKEVRRIQLGASMDWKGTFDNLPEVDEAGNEISYSLKEISAVGNDGKPLDYQMAQADASEAVVTEEKIWLPVSRPGKTSNGEEYGEN